MAGGTAAHENPATQFKFGLIGGCEVRTGTLPLPPAKNKTSEAPPNGAVPLDCAQATVNAMKEHPAQWEIQEIACGAVRTPIFRSSHSCILIIVCSAAYKTSRVHLEDDLWNYELVNPEAMRAALNSF